VDLTNPFGMAELIAHKVQITLSTESHREQANHLVQSNSTLNDLRKAEQVNMYPT
jgi:hypothetical protein